MTKLHFDEATHTYTLDGTKLPSVTHLIRYLDVDVDKSRPWMRDEAAERGTIVHNLCAMMDYGEDISEETPFYLQGYVNAYANFLRDYDVRWELIERPDWAERDGLRFAGTLDRFGYVNGNPFIVDIKTGTSGSDARHSAQLSAYSLFPCINTSPVALAVLYLRKDGTYRFKQQTRSLKLFDACCLLHKETGGKLPK